MHILPCSLGPTTRHAAWKVIHGASLAVALHCDHFCSPWLSLALVLLSVHEAQHTAGQLQGLSSTQGTLGSAWATHLQVLLQGACKGNGPVPHGHPVVLLILRDEYSRLFAHVRVEIHVYFCVYM